MCYFIHLAITPQGKSADVEAILGELAQNHKLYMRGQYPDGLAITDGQCSCDLVVPTGLKKPIPEFLRDLVGSEAIKNIQVGWLFGDKMPADAEVERLSIAEFIHRNTEYDLKTEVWYRLSDPEKYHFEPNHFAP